MSSRSGPSVCASTSNAASPLRDEEGLTYLERLATFEDVLNDGREEDFMGEVEWERAVQARIADREERIRLGEQDVLMSDSEAEDSPDEADDDELPDDAAQAPQLPRGVPPSGYDHPWLQEFVEEVGARNIPEELNSECGFFELFFGEDVIQMLVTETNRYATQCVEAAQGREDSPWSRVNQWKPVTAQDVKNFLALVLLMELKNPTRYGLG